MEELKKFSDEVIMDKYISTKETISRLEDALEGISIADTENYSEVEDEIEGNVEYLNDLAHEMMGRLISRR